MRSQSIDFWYDCGTNIRNAFVDVCRRLSEMGNKFSKGFKKNYQVKGGSYPDEAGVTAPVTTYYRKLDIDGVCPDDVHHSPRSDCEEEGDDTPLRSDNEAMNDSGGEVFDTGPEAGANSSADENEAGESHEANSGDVGGDIQMVPEEPSSEQNGGDVSLGSEDQSEKLIQSNDLNENTVEDIEIKDEAPTMEPKDKELLSNEDAPQDITNEDAIQDAIQESPNDITEEDPPIQGIVDESQVNAETPEPAHTDELSSTGEFSPERRDKSSSLTSVTDTDSSGMAENEVQDGGPCHDGEDEHEEEGESLLVKETHDVEQNEEESSCDEESAEYVTAF